MSAPFRGAILNCKTCGATFKVPPSRAATAEFCSRECKYAVIGERLKKRVTLVCAGCKQPFNVPRSHANRRTFCSEDCRRSSDNYRWATAQRMRRENNPRWRGGIVGHTDGYLYEYAPDHPFASNRYVLAHRLAMERWLRENDQNSPFLIRLGEQMYLSPEYHVHHRDENKQHNAIENLECLTPSEHQRHHRAVRRQSRKDIPDEGHDQARLPCR